MATYPRIRVYGPSRNRGSFRAVVEGVLQGLAACGARHAFVPTDQALDPDDLPPLATAEVGLYIGGPERIEYTRFGTKHERVFLLLAPNGYGLGAHIPALCAGFNVLPLGTSRWAAEVLKRAFGLPQVGHYHHGVDPALATISAEEEANAHPGLDALHITSTCTDRKGTLSLLDAWEGRDQILAIHTDMLQAPKLRERLDPEKHRSVYVDAKHIPRERLGAWYRSFAFVIQPSRCEGFSLVPLEAAASGVPVFTTDTTGQRDYVLDLPRPDITTVRIEGEPVEIEGEDFAVDPLSRGEVDYLVDLAASKVPFLTREAMARRHDIVAKWSWEAVTRRWLESL